MAFDSYASSKTEKKLEVDYEALNKHIIEAAQLEKQETVVGYISSIIDLGEQEQEDAEFEFDGDASAEAEEIKVHPNTYFKDGRNELTGKAVRLKCFPQKPIQSVAISVDFPDILIDKGQFYGESNPLPLRMYLGGEFFIKDVGKIVGRPTPLKINKSMVINGKNVWSFDKKHLLHKMAVAAKIIDSNEPFLPQRIDELLGKPLQFACQIYMKETKGKKYLTETIKFVGGLGRGQSAPAIVKTPFLIQFNQENKDEDLKEIRWHVINTIRRAGNFEGSPIQAQLTKLGMLQAKTEQQDDAPKQEETKAEVPSEAVQVNNTPVDDDNSPF